MNNTILEYSDRYIAGYSLKQNKVITTHDVNKAKRFTAVTANNFIYEHRAIIDVAAVKFHMFKRGMPIDQQVKLSWEDK